MLAALTSAGAETELDMHTCLCSAERCMQLSRTLNNTGGRSSACVDALRQA
jgi:hypothetical protein